MKRSVLISLVGAVVMLMLAGSAQAGSKSYVCHKGDDGRRHTLKIGSPAVPAHEAHGDFVGKCEDAPPEPKEVVMLRCLADVLDTPLTVSSLSATENAPIINADPTFGLGDSCALSIATLLDDGFMLRQVLGDDAGGLATFYLLVR